MSVHAALYHRTLYRYDRLVGLGPQLVRLRPAPHCRTPILAYSLKVEPHPHFLNWQQDPFGNWMARLVFPEEARALSVTVDLIADLAVINPFDFFVEPAAERFPFTYDDALAQELAPFLRPALCGPRLAGFLGRLDRTPRRTVDFVMDVNAAVKAATDYIIRLEPGVWAPEETLAQGKGSCRDSAWLLVQALRQLGLAARFVSGYLIQLKADEAPREGPAGPDSDFTDLHAWAEVYLPGAGWIGLDATSGLAAGEGHIPLAATPEPQSAAPVSGTVSESESTLEVEMRVSRVRELPRTTLPYDDATWTRICAAGRRVDARLAAGDVRLTMGGEPTFVAEDNRDAPEWNSDALGPHKRRLANRLVRRLADRFAGPGPLLHMGQGKWYPGEPLPRWAFTALWRRDGEPIWTDPTLRANEDVPSGADTPEALAVGTALSDLLGLDPDRLIPAYEDAFYYLWKERRLPVNVDPFDSRLKDELERARLARLFEAGLDRVVGYALPLRRVEGRWVSGPWFFRPERMYLIPGDSPMGYRLPLDSLPWVVPGELPALVEPDPFAPRDPLPPRAAYGRETAGGPSGQPFRRVPAPFQELGPGQVGQSLEPHPAERALPPARFVSDDRVVRTALCLEARGGVLHAFLPPVAAAEDALDLIAALEGAAARAGVPLQIEGYKPPSDPRLVSFAVTPDPGVIEVNIHPSASWAELEDRTLGLYEAARAEGLVAEKFALDGKHVGTGGGNHVVLGGATAAESPFLRRPDVLVSLIATWLDHPSLSYLFSGQFIGPTSQHPRLDEARPDQLHEFELARAALARAGSVPPPWLVDRILRNVLVDATGNTHRTEFSIDKLYTPEGPTGRLGLVELRAFEMPPHARMSLAQQLLVRALLARAWEWPHARPVARWGTRLHEDFLLPHVCWQDFCDVIDGLKTDGFPLERGWFEPHFQFRFPPIGGFATRGVEVELRHALEPWHVLGEEPGAGGTVRFVDASLERLQVKARGLVPGRHVLAVNGRALPLRETGVPGEVIAGVRFKAWAPPNALHPTLPVHTPLVFDLWDAWSGRSLGGCTYHVAHPGGRNYTTFPVNANEAEARRRARFFAMGHTPGSMPAPKPAVSRDFPLTLDLRRPMEG